MEKSSRARGRSSEPSRCALRLQQGTGTVGRLPPIGRWGQQVPCGRPCHDPLDSRRLLIAPQHRSSVTQNRVVSPSNQILTKVRENCRCAAFLQHFHKAPWNTCLYSYTVKFVKILCVGFGTAATPMPTSKKNHLQDPCQRTVHALIVPARDRHTTCKQYYSS